MVCYDMTSCTSLCAAICLPTTRTHRRRLRLHASVVQGLVHGRWVLLEYREGEEAARAQRSPTAHMTIGRKFVLIGDPIHNMAVLMSRPDPSAMMPTLPPYTDGHDLTAARASPAHHSAALLQRRPAPPQRQERDMRREEIYRTLVTFERAEQQVDATAFALEPKPASASRERQIKPAARSGVSTLTSAHVSDLKCTQHTLTGSTDLPPTYASLFGVPVGFGVRSTALPFLALILPLFALAAVLHRMRRRRTHPLAALAHDRVAVDASTSPLPLPAHERELFSPERETPNPFALISSDANPSAAAKQLCHWPASPRTKQPDACVGSADMRELASKPLPADAHGRLRRGWTCWQHYLRSCRTDALVERRLRAMASACSPTLMAVRRWGACVAQRQRTALLFAFARWRGLAREHRGARWFGAACTRWRVRHALMHWQRRALVSRASALRIRVLSRRRSGRLLRLSLSAWAEHARAAQRARAADGRRLLRLAAQWLRAWRRACTRSHAVVRSGTLAIVKPCLVGSAIGGIGECAQPRALNASRKRVLAAQATGADLCDKRVDECAFDGPCDVAAYRSQPAHYHTSCRSPTHAHDTTSPARLCDASACHSERSFDDVSLSASMLLRDISFSGVEALVDETSRCLTQMRSLLSSPEIRQRCSAHAVERCDKATEIDSVGAPLPPRAAAEIARKHLPNSQLRTVAPFARLSLTLVPNPFTPSAAKSGAVSERVRAAPRAPAASVRPLSRDSTPREYDASRLVGAASPATRTQHEHAATIGGSAAPSRARTPHASRPRAAGLVTTPLGARPPTPGSSLVGGKAQGRTGSGGGSSGRSDAAAGSVPKSPAAVPRPKTPTTTPHKIARGVRLPITPKTPTAGPKLPKAAK